MAGWRREALAWCLVVMMSAQLLVVPEYISTDQLLMLSGKMVLVLSVIWLLNQTLKLYFVPTNRIRTGDAFGSVRPAATKNRPLKGSLSAKNEQVNEVRRRQRAATMPPPYPNAWFAALESRDLVPGQVRPLNILGLHLVVFRTHGGEARILDGICPHLGADLAQGCVLANAIQCPFHKWSFDGETGEVVDVPYSKQSAASLRHFSVGVWPVFEANGIIHVWHHAEGDPPCWHPTEYPEISSGEYRYCGRTQHTVYAHIQDLPENGADPAHLAAIHEKIFMDGTDLEERFIWSWIKHQWSANWAPDPDHKHRASISMHMTFNLLQRFHFYHSDVTVRQVGPGLVYIDFTSPLGSGVIQQLVTPVGDLEQHVVHTVHWDFSYGFGPLIAKFYLFVEAQQFERDVRIWNNKDHLPRPGLVKEDSTIIKYRRWFSQFYSENSRRPLQAIDSLEL